MERTLATVDVQPPAMARGGASPPQASTAAQSGAHDAGPAGWLQRVEGRLDALLEAAGGTAAPLQAAMREAALAPGKRLRPLLVLAATSELGADPRAALDAACALELVHAASLVLDDLPCMDDARLRRGRPALHVSVGQDVAILAAIALLSRGFGVVARDERLGAGHRAAITAALADCVGTEGLAAGQFEDLRGAPSRRDAGDARRCNLAKTGAPFAAAVEIGAIVASAAPDQRARLLTFARHLGCAFQVRDDLLDTTATSTEVGKDTGRDGGKRTVVELLGAERAVRQMRAHLAAARRAASPPGERSRPADGPLARVLHASFGPELRAMAAG